MSDVFHPVTTQFARVAKEFFPPDTLGD